MSRAGNRLQETSPRPQKFSCMALTQGCRTVMRADVSGNSRNTPLGNWVDIRPTLARPTDQRIVAFKALIQRRGSVRSSLRRRCLLAQASHPRPSLRCRPPLRSALSAALQVWVVPPDLPLLPSVPRREGRGAATQHLLSRKEKRRLPVDRSSLLIEGVFKNGIFQFSGSALIAAPLKETKGKQPLSLRFHYLVHLDQSRHFGEWGLRNRFHSRRKRKLLSGSLKEPQILLITGLCQRRSKARPVGRRETRPLPG
jgi:hypothetical protein